MIRRSVLFMAMIGLISVMSVSHASAASDISISKKASASTADQHDTVTFTLTVKNDNSETVETSIEDSFEEGLVYKESSFGGTSCVENLQEPSVAGNTVVFDAVRVESGCVFTIDVVFGFSQNSCDTNIGNTASVVATHEVNLCTYSTENCKHSSYYTCLIQSFADFNECSGVDCRTEASKGYGVCVQEKEDACNGSEACLEDLREECAEVGRADGLSCINDADVPSKTVTSSDQDSASVDVTCSDQDVAGETNPIEDTDDDVQKNDDTDTVKDNTDGDRQAQQVTGVCSESDYANIEGTIWSDENGDGTEDSDDEGIQGVTVVLKDGDGVVLGEEDTDDDGQFRFENFAPGRYVVDIDEDDKDLAGYTETYEMDNNLNGKNQFTLKCDHDYTKSSFGYTDGSADPQQNTLSDGRPQKLSKTGGEISVMNYLKGLVDFLVQAVR